MLVFLLLCSILAWWFSLFAMLDTLGSDDTDDTVCSRKSWTWTCTLCLCKGVLESSLHILDDVSVGVCNCSWFGIDIEIVWFFFFYLHAYQYATWILILIPTKEPEHCVQCSVQCQRRKEKAEWYPVVSYSHWCWQFSLGPLLLSYLGAIAININWLSPFPRFFNIITFTTYPRPQWKLLPPRPWCNNDNFSMLYCKRTLMP